MSFIEACFQAMQWFFRPNHSPNQTPWNTNVSTIDCMWQSSHHIFGSYTTALHAKLTAAIEAQLKR